MTKFDKKRTQLIGILILLIILFTLVATMYFPYNIYEKTKSNNQVKFNTDLSKICSCVKSINLLEQDLYNLNAQFVK